MESFWVGVYAQNKKRHGGALHKFPQITLLKIIKISNFCRSDDAGAACVSVPFCPYPDLRLELLKAQNFTLPCAPKTYCSVRP
jgi:hypothetical protein